MDVSRFHFRSIICTISVEFPAVYLILIGQKVYKPNRTTEEAFFFPESVAMKTRVKRIQSLFGPCLQTPVTLTVLIQNYMNVSHGSDLLVLLVLFHTARLNTTDTLRKYYNC